MRILITGVAGFIGSNLASFLLNKGHSVCGLDNLSYGVVEQIPAGVDFYKMDIRSPEIHSLFNQVEVVFHLAAKNCIPDCQDDPVETADINVTGTVNVFEACCKAGVQKVIYAESSAVYEGSRTFPTTEEEEKPESFYAISKYAEKFFAEGFQRFYGLNMTALRYFNVYGPRQDYRRTVPPLMSAMIIKMLKGERPIIYGDGTKRRDFIYVDDVNRFHELVMTRTESNGQTYNIGSGANYSVYEIYKEIEALLKTGLQPEYKPDLPGEAFQNLADISKARTLGWQPEVSLQEGLRQSIDYIQHHVLK